MPIPNQTLSTGREMPVIGLGLWKLPDDEVADVIVEAIRRGYRHLDGACDYGNEVGVGAGIRRAIEEGLCTREDLWVTSKLWNTYHRRQHVGPAIEKSLELMQLDYVDLYLMHFPIALAFVPFDTRYPPEWLHDPDAEMPMMKTDAVPLAETWAAMEALQVAGLTRDIGLSNCNTGLVRDLMNGASQAPAVLQVESHPYLTQDKLLRFCREEDIAVTAYSPLGALSYVELGMADAGEAVIEQPVVQSIAERLGRTPAQVVLRWGIQRGTSIIPKTSRVERLEENAALFDFKLDAEDMRAISSLDRGQRFNDPGVFCEAAFNTYFPIYD